MDCIRSSTRAERTASSSAASSFGRFGPHHPDQARTVARQRHLRERSRLGVEFGRDEAVRAAVREVENQSRLRIVACRCPDAGGVPCRRQAPVGRDRQRGFDHRCVGQPRGHAVISDRPCLDQRLSPFDRRSLHDSGFKNGVEVAVGDIQPEMIGADLRRAKGHDRAADQPARRVDDAHDLERRGLRGKARRTRRARPATSAPASSAPWSGDRRRGPRADESDLHAQAGERQRRDHADRTGARDHDPQIPVPCSMTVVPCIAADVYGTRRRSINATTGHPADRRRRGLVPGKPLLLLSASVSPALGRQGATR